MIIGLLLAAVSLTTGSGIEQFDLTAYPDVRGIVEDLYASAPPGNSSTLEGVTCTLCKSFVSLVSHAINGPFPEYIAFGIIKTYCRANSGGIGYTCKGAFQCEALCNIIDGFGPVFVEIAPQFRNDEDETMICHSLGYCEAPVTMGADGLRAPSRMLHASPDAHSAAIAKLQALPQIGDGPLPPTTAIVDAAVSRWPATALRRDPLTSTTAASAAAAADATAATDAALGAPPVVFRFAHVTDMHINLDYAVGSWTDCGLPTCCYPVPYSGREAQTANTTAGRYGDDECDGSPELVDSLAKDIATIWHQGVSAVGWRDPAKARGASQTHEAHASQLQLAHGGADGAASVRAVDRSTRRAPTPPPPAVPPQSFTHLFFTGDIPPHDVWNQSAAENTLTIIESTARLARGMPSAIRVLPALGNHAAFPVNCLRMNVSHRDDRALLYTPLAEAWRRLGWLSQVDADAFRTSGGAYVPAPIVIRRNVTVDGRRPVTHDEEETIVIQPIVLNSVLYGEMNFFRLPAAAQRTDPGAQLALLSSLLAAAASRGVYVYVLWHHPFNGWVPTARAALRDVLRPYVATVAGMFCGHTHQDETHVVWMEEVSTSSSSSSNGGATTSSVVSAAIADSRAAGAQAAAPTAATTSVTSEDGSLKTYVPAMVMYNPGCIESYDHRNPSYRIYDVVIDRIGRPVVADWVQRRAAMIPEWENNVDMTGELEWYTAYRASHEYPLYDSPSSSTQRSAVALGPWTAGLRADGFTAVTWVSLAVRIFREAVYDNNATLLHRYYSNWVATNPHADMVPSTNHSIYAFVCKSLLTFGEEDIADDVCRMLWVD